MRVCVVHQNIPAQHRHLIGALLKRGDEVLAIGGRAAVDRWQLKHPKLGTIAYATPPEGQAASVPPHLRELDTQISRGKAVADALRLIKAKGLKPDLVLIHPGWGEALFVRAELPDVPLLGYCEFFYHRSGADVGFDPEFTSSDAALRQIQIRKAPHLLAIDDFDAGLCPTNWQRMQFPEGYRSKLHVIHDGIDTDAIAPDPKAEWALGGRMLRHGDPVVTYVARNLEPYRGFHIFMRCLPRLQQLVPQATVVVVGGDGVSYGLRLPEGETYRARMLRELGDRVDWSRVHFVGRLPYATYLKVLQVSAVHAYLTYPFVLSWSMLEAMSAGCCIVASRTPPVQEVMTDGINGLLVDFFDHDGLAGRLADVLLCRVESGALRQAARAHVLQNFDLQRLCLPRTLALVDSLVG